MAPRIVHFVGGPLDGETKKIPPCRVYLWPTMERFHTYRLKSVYDGKLSYVGVHDQVSDDAALARIKNG